MAVFKQFATNRKLEAEGVPLRFDPNPDGTVPTIFVRRVYQESQKYQAVHERITRPYKYQIDKKVLSEADDHRLMQRVCAETAIVGWENWRMPEGIAGGKGEGNEYYDNRADDEKALSLEELQKANGQLYDIPFSVDAVCDTFHVLPDLWKRCAITAVDPDSFKEGELEDIAKNL